MTSKMTIAVCGLRAKEARRLADRCRPLNVELRFVERGCKRARVAHVTIMTRWTGHSHGYQAAKNGSRVVFLDAGLGRIAELVAREFQTWVAAA